MKTTTKLTALIATIALFLAFNLNAMDMVPKFVEEQYIDDIPFDTEKIYDEVMLAEITFEEEAYINDIPFELPCVTPECKYKQAISLDFEAEEEAYIDDVPFNTEKIAADHSFKIAMNATFENREEEYIDDIPFSTCVIASIANKGQKELYVSGK